MSVLLPAFKPDYLGQAIASVLCQGFQDFEFLIHDDSAGGDVAAVVDQFRDPRIRYKHVAGANGARNLRGLWDAASFDVRHCMFDDDVLLPHALRVLTDLLEAHPQASFVFGHRDIIDGAGRRVSEPRVIAPGKVATLGRNDLSAMMIRDLRNCIGEFPNALMNRKAGLTADDLFVYRGYDIEMLADVGFFLNAGDKGPVIGTSQTVSQYRKHGAQNSSIGYHPRFFKGIMEWELFVRGEYAGGHLTADQAGAALEKLDKAYSTWGEKLPVLRVMQAGVRDLRARIAAGQADAFDPTFRQNWERATENGAQFARPAAP